MFIKSYELLGKYGMNGLAHFTLSPITPSSYYRAIAQVGQSYQNSTRLSKYFNYFQSAHILAGTKRGNILTNSVEL